MKKSLLIKSSAVVLALGVAAGVAAGAYSLKAVEAKAVDETVVNFVAGTDTGDTTVTKDDVTIVATTMSNANYYQAYKSQTLSVSTTDGTITKIEFVCTAQDASKYGPGCFVVSAGDGEYSYSSYNGTWTGDASSVVFTASLNQVRMKSIAVTVAREESSAVVSSFDVPESLTLDADGADSVSDILEYEITYAQAEGNNKINLSVEPAYGLNVTADSDTSEIFFDATYPGNYVVTATTVDKDADGESVTKTINVSVENLVLPNLIQRMYSLSAGTKARAVGYYVGSVANGPIVANGEYGILLYGGTAPESWVVGETVVAVDGSMSIYQNLYELNVSGLSDDNIVSDQSVLSSVAAPVTLILDENVDLTDLSIANRKTSVTGLVSSIVQNKAEVEDASSVDLGVDLSVYVTVGDSQVLVYMKKNSYTSDQVNDIFEGKTNPITIEGFSSFYKTFQLSFVDIVKASETYTANDFAADLLAKVAEVCGEYGTINLNDNESALKLVWSELSGSSYYLQLSQEEKEVLADASRAGDLPEGTATDLNKAVELYDYLCGKYGLGNFITGRTPMSFNASGNFAKITNNSAIIAMVAVSSAVIVGAFLAVYLKNKKRRAE